MKKTTFLFGLIILIVLGLTVEKLFPNGLSFSSGLGVTKSNHTDLHKKYADCIQEANFLTHVNHELREYPIEQKEVLDVLLKNLERYQRSLDFTVKNLNTIDAHEFLHNEFEKSKRLIQKDKTSEIQGFYFSKAMEICYSLDKSLNQDLKDYTENSSK
ncbi:MAG: hypothetical protein ABJN84_11320 [Flavobacteriaceae bacterium]